VVIELVAQVPKQAALAHRDLFWWSIENEKSIGFFNRKRAQPKHKRSYWLAYC
jgi:hypothetical protein